MTDKTSLAASIAPEDVVPGDFVAVLYEVVEVPSFFWPETIVDSTENVRMRHIPSGSGTPLKVKAVCLPFVYVESPCGRCEIVDLRRVQLVRLDHDYAKVVRKTSRKQPAATVAVKRSSPA